MTQVDERHGASLQKLNQFAGRRRIGFRVNRNGFVTRKTRKEDIGGSRNRKRRIVREPFNRLCASNCLIMSEKDSTIRHASKLHTSIEHNVKINS